MTTHPSAREAIVQRIAADRGIANLPADEQATATDLIRCWVDEVLGAARAVESNQ